MERTSALALTSRIEATWSNGRPWHGAKCDAWVDALCELDEGAAGTTFARLRSTHPETPSIAQFIASARSLTTTDASNREKCGDCTDSGWVDAPSFERHGVTYTAVKPCRCSAGEQAARSTAWTLRSQPA